MIVIVICLIHPSNPTFKGRKGGKKPGPNLISPLPSPAFPSVAQRIILTAQEALHEFADPTAATEKAFDGVGQRILSLFGDLPALLVKPLREIDGIIGLCRGRRSGGVDKCIGAGIGVG